MGELHRVGKAVVSVTVKEVRHRGRKIILLALSLKTASCRSQHPSLLMFTVFLVLDNLAVLRGTIETLPKHIYKGYLSFRISVGTHSSFLCFSERRKIANET